MAHFGAIKMFVSANVDYMKQFRGHCTTTNQLFILYYYCLYNQARGNFRRYLSHYLLKGKQELWGKNTTIYMK